MDGLLMVKPFAGAVQVFWTAAGRCVYPLVTISCSFVTSGENPKQGRRPRLTFAARVNGDSGNARLTLPIAYSFKVLFH
ncbi:MULTISPECIES: hypothetical protein [Cupriavidus]|uniref:hypothetical protein n=1 Tax=Cupriavidus sp. DF5525 TaxID=3160989 RepID=UPI0032DE69CB